MTIRFACPACNATMKAHDDKAGVHVKCVGCGQRLQIPPPPRGTVVAKALPPISPATPSAGTAAPESPPSHEAEVAPVRRPVPTQRANDKLRWRLIGCGLAAVVFLLLLIVIFL